MILRRMHQLLSRIKCRYQKPRGKLMVFSSVALKLQISYRWHNCYKTASKRFVTLNRRHLISWDVIAYYGHTINGVVYLIFIIFQF